MPQSDLINRVRRGRNFGSLLGLELDIGYTLGGCGRDQIQKKPACLSIEC